MTHPKATQENTVFLAVDAFEDFELKTQAFRQTARENDIPVMYCDEGAPWQGFHHHKIEMMFPRLERLREQGYQYVFLLDCRDIVFIDPVERILEKFNGIDQGKVIFNHDMPGAVWPSHHSGLMRAMEQAMHSEHARLNAGAMAGRIETLLSIQHHVMELRRELLEGRPREGILRGIHDEMGVKHSDDDQHLYQICLCYYPELFQIDYDKRLFALLMHYPKDIHECSDNPHRHDVINSASIIHSPWLARKPEWNDRAIHHQWKRKVDSQ